MGNHVPLKVTYINTSIYIHEFPTNCNFKGIWYFGVWNSKCLFLGDLCLNFKYLVLLTKMTTKYKIVQGIIFHELIGKRKPAMNQLCHGLERFQVLECIRKIQRFSSQFLCVWKNRNHLLVYLKYWWIIIKSRLNKILFFSTGSNMRPYLHKKVKIQAADSDMIFGSTCTNTITVPKSLKNKDEVSSFFKCIFYQVRYIRRTDFSLSFYYKVLWLLFIPLYPLKQGL